MQKVLSVRKFIYLFISLLIIGCVAQRKVFEKESEYKIKKFKTFSPYHSWINIKTYSKELQENIPALIKINNLYFTEKTIFDAGEGKHNISIDFVGTIGLKINDLKVNKGDSIIINVYLREDPTPISD
ncbi:hypothetical protein ACQY1Q_17245 [Tenacibaculum sp. TC6]|uniref:hypothetical protein n=1 Tax=Tenacibaculum sp. TC6 TaxID=3423223 RepID=UPI003D36E2B9